MVNLAKVYKHINLPEPTYKLDAFALFYPNNEPEAFSPRHSAPDLGKSGQSYSTSFSPNVKRGHTPSMANKFMEVQK